MLFVVLSLFFNLSLFAQTAAKDSILGLADVAFVLSPSSPEIHKAAALGDPDVSGCDEPKSEPTCANIGPGTSALCEKTITHEEGSVVVLDPEKGEKVIKTNKFGIGVEVVKGLRIGARAGIGRPRAGISFKTGF